MAKKTESTDLLGEDEKNARTIGRKNLSGLSYSITEFGDLSRITWNEQLGKLVCGNQRMRVLRDHGATNWSRLSENEGVIVDPKTGETFSIRIVRWEEQKHRAAQLVANNPHIQGEFTADAIAQMRQLEQELQGFEALNLKELEADLDSLVEQVDSEHRGLEDFDAIPRARPTWILVAAPEDVATDIENNLRSRYGSEPGVRIEKSTDAR